MLFDAPLNSNVNIKKYNNSINPIIHNDENYDIVIILDKKYPKIIIDKFKSIVLSSNNNNRVKFLILNCFNFRLSKDPSKIIDFYADSSIDFKKYIHSKSKIITVGRALYSIIKSDDLDIKGFYDIDFNKSYFYDSYLDSLVFPINNIYTFISNNKIKNNFEFKFATYQIKKAYETKFEDVVKQRIKKIVCDDPNQFLKENLNKDCYMACDIETNTLDPWLESAKILEVTISFDGKVGYLLPWDKINKSLFNEFLKNKKLIMHNGKFDTKFFILVGDIERDNIHIYYDVWNGSHVINELQRSSLKSDAWLYTIHGGYDRELDAYLKKYPHCKNDYSKIPKEIRYPYAIMDAIVTFQIYENHLKVIERIDRKFPMPNGWSLKRYLFECVLPSNEVFLDIELEGMYVNWDLLKEYSTQLKKEIENIKSQIIDKFDVDFDPDTSNELGAVLEMKNWPCYGRSKDWIKKSMLEKFNLEKKKVYLTGEKQFLQWESCGYKEEVTLLRKYREIKTLYNTFIGNEKENSGFFQYRKRDNKIHSTFGPFLTNSGRNWSKNPNLQNIPKHGNQAEWYRKIFIPPSKDYVIDEKDASGFQLRIGAIFSQDEAMIKVFTELGGDMHSMTAQSVLKRDISLDEFLKLRKEKNKEIEEIRFKAKSINFQLEFGATAFNFASTVIENEWDEKEIDKYIIDNDLHMVVNKRLSLLKSGSNEQNMFTHVINKEHFAKCWAVASHIRDRYFQKYIGLDTWIKETIVNAELNGYVRSPFGAIRRLPQLKYQGKDDNPGTIKNLKNISLNSPVQNFENVIMMSMAKKMGDFIKENNLKSKLCGNIHDAIVSYTHRDEIDILNEIAKKEFEKDRKENMGIPLIMDCEISDYEKGQVWGFGTEIK